jgi:hypothetical protein
MAEQQHPRACGNPACAVSQSIDEVTFTFGSGELDEHGYWSEPCHACAAAFLRRNPEAMVWPDSTVPTKEEARKERLERARTIVEQIGRRAMFMLGARDVLATEKGVRFRIGRNGRSINLIEIEVENDLYTIKYSRVRSDKKFPVAGDEGVYAEQLAKFISATTGMAVSL